jgi:hypothetical protein
MTHRLQCQCGRLRGQVNRTELAILGKCYCKDCRTYAAHLQKLAVTHDSAGGAEFVATSANHVVFDHGEENLACLSLSERGLLRWYAACCSTPVANTTRDWRFPYVGLFHTCLKHDRASYERAFPNVQMHVNTRSATTKPAGSSFRTVIALSRLLPRLFASRFSRSYETTPFFRSPEGQPSVAVHVLSREERERAREASRETL